MRCQFCGEEVAWLVSFQCSYCQGYFCIEHRLPENHECPSFIKEKFWNREDTIVEQPLTERPTLGIEGKKPRQVNEQEKEPAQNWDVAENGLGLFALGIMFGILSYGAQTNPFGFGLALGFILLLFAGLGGILLGLTFLGLLLLIFLLVLAVVVVGFRETFGILAGILIVPLVFILIAVGARLYGLPVVVNILSAISVIFVVSGIGLMIWDLTRHIHKYARARAIS